MHGKRVVLVGVLVAGMGLAWAEPPSKNLIGKSISKLQQAVSARDWAAPPAEELTAQAQDVPQPAEAESPLPEEDAAPEPAPAAPAPVEAVAAPAPLEPVQPLQPVSPTEAPAPAPALEKPTYSLLQRVIKLKEVDVDAMYRSYQAAFPQETISLSLEDCVYRALKANQDILVNTYEPLKASADILAAKGEFDPALFTETTYTETTQSLEDQLATTQATSLQDSFTRSIAERFLGLDFSEVKLYQTDSNSGIQGKLPWGTVYSAAVSVSKQETSFAQADEEWTGGLVLSLSQPLLRGGWYSANRARIRQAANSRRIADSQLRGTVLQAVSDTVKAYWDLVGAIENVEARQKAVDSATRLMEIQRKRLELGNAAEIEVIQAAAGLTTRKSDLISAQSQVEAASDQLKSLLGFLDEDTVAPKRVVPTDKPNVSDVELNQLQSMALALKNRPEIEGAETQIDTARIEQQRLANGMMPQLDLTGSVAAGGTGSSADDAFDGVRDRQTKTYTVGVQGSLPIGNRAARGAHQRAWLSTRQAQQQLEQVRQSIILSVQMAMNNVATSRVLVESTKQTQTLQEVNLEAETKRLQLGVSTSYRVLEVESDLTLARTQYIQALVNFQKAVTDLRQAEGVLLDTFGIEFVPPEAEEPVSYIRSVLPVPVK